MANSIVVRVVLDTNVLISAALKPGGLEAAVVNMVLKGDLELWVTSEVWAEYEDVLGRPKFTKVREESHSILRALETRARTTTADAISILSCDEDDNRFIECAQSAHAEFFVTGNLRHYPPSWGATRAVSARQFLNVLENTVEL